MDSKDDITFVFLCANKELCRTQQRHTIPLELLPPGGPFWDCIHDTQNNKSIIEIVDDSNAAQGKAATYFTPKEFLQIVEVLKGKLKLSQCRSRIVAIYDKYFKHTALYGVRNTLEEQHQTKLTKILSRLDDLECGRTDTIFCSDINEYTAINNHIIGNPNIVPVQLISFNNICLFACCDNGVYLTPEINNKVINNLNIELIRWIAIDKIQELSIDSRDGELGVKCNNDLAKIRDSNVGLNYAHNARTVKFYEGRGCGIGPCGPRGFAHEPSDDLYQYRYIDLLLGHLCSVECRKIKLVDGINDDIAQAQVCDCYAIKEKHRPIFMECVNMSSSNEIEYINAVYSSIIKKCDNLGLKFPMNNIKLRANDIYIDLYNKFDKCDLTGANVIKSDCIDSRYIIALHLGFTNISFKSR